jgi:hypothetical protein
LEGEEYEASHMLYRDVILQEMGIYRAATTCASASTGDMETMVSEEKEATHEPPSTADPTSSI